MALATVAVTTDIRLPEPLVLDAGAHVLWGPKGNVVLPRIRSATGLATRSLLEMLRQSGEIGGGPAPFAKADRSRFLGKLDRSLHLIRRETLQREQMKRRLSGGLAKWACEIKWRADGSSSSRFRRLWPRSGYGP